MGHRRKERTGLRTKVRLLKVCYRPRKVFTNIIGLHIIVFSSHKVRVNGVAVASAARRLFSVDDSGRLVSYSDIHSCPILINDERYTMDQLLLKVDIVIICVIGVLGHGCSSNGNSCMADF